MKVSNMTGRSGRAVPNQYIINTPGATYFQSYGSVIAKTTFEDGERVVYLDETYWDYSRTTSKYRNAFLGLTTKETKARIDDGRIRLADLNSQPVA